MYKVFFKGDTDLTVFICLDKGGGMLFNERRQSRDSKVIADIINSVGEDDLYIKPFSSELFSQADGIIESAAPFDERDAKFIFAEDMISRAQLEKADKLIIYRWNKVYPADVYFDFSPTSEGMRLSYKLEFAGSSHECITKEVYKK